MKTGIPATKQHAIVLGGSLAGLLTAKVLSRYYTHVSIIERDTVHYEPEARKGQPQTRHLHGLLPSGLQLMCKDFPGLLDELITNDARVLDFADSMNWYCYGGFKKSFPIGIKGVLVSRPLLEHIIRERVVALSNVRLIDNTAAKQLLSNEKKDRITGVVAEEKNMDRTISLSADLIIDTTGRASRAPQWLRELGYEEVKVSQVKINVGYTTRLYRRDRKDARGETWIVYTPAAPSETRFGAAFPIEGDKWMVTVGGFHGDHAPTDTAGYLEFVRTLKNPDLYDIVSKSEPVSDFFQYKFPLSSRKHYEKLRRFPLGFVVLGDAISSFNPIYGQGMSSAALQADVLNKMFEQNVAEEDFANEFFKRSLKIVDNIWNLATGEDFRYPQTVGTKPPFIKLINRYVAQVHRATIKDEVVCGAFLKVMALLEPPASLFHPKILWRVMTKTLKTT